MLMAISQRVVCKLELYDKPSKIMMLAGRRGGGYKTLRLKIVYVCCATKAKSLQPSKLEDELSKTMKHNGLANRMI